MPVVLLFFVAWVTDSIGVAVNALPNEAIGTAKAAVIFLFYFVLATAEGTMGGRAGGKMMTSIRLLQCGCPVFFSRWRGQSCPPCSSG